MKVTKNAFCYFYTQKSCRTTKIEDMLTGTRNNYNNTLILLFSEYFFRKNRLAKTIYQSNVYDIFARIVLFVSCVVS